MICIIYIFLFFVHSIICQPNFVLIGPPGAGKGTFSNYMIKNYGYRQICPGDILRKHIKDGTPLGKQIQLYVEKGEDVDPAIVYKIMTEEINDCIEKKIPFIIDGFPRDNKTYEFLKTLLQEKKLNFTITFIHFVIDNKTCLSRINDRLICPKCNTIYNKTTNKPKNNNRCDQCAHQLDKRIGDIPENTIKRLEIYRKKIEPLTQLAKADFKLVTIKTKKSLQHCKKLYEIILGQQKK